MYLCMIIFPVLLLAAIAEQLNTKLTLPWGTWQANPLPGNNEIYIFQNVRFGGVPTRFGNSSTPDAIQDNSTVQDSSYGPSCYQVFPGRDNQLKSGNPVKVPPPDIPQSEDCLFLDIYVPAASLQPNAEKLPVIVWFYGGAYAFGSKLQFGTDEVPFYTGQGILEAANNRAIFVTGNYRLGAFGWLAGSYMEKEGLPNAGLYDQRLLLAWVERWISDVGGDNTAISAWGESAGAGSILHHLIRENGTHDPGFSKALLQSPAFEWQWDRSGTLDNTYRTFSKSSDCGYTFNISCLRSANITKLVNANSALYSQVSQTRIFPLGPSVDGTWIKELPAARFAENARWPNLTSIMISHVANESGTFTPQNVINTTTFNDYLNLFMPEVNLALVRAAILKQYSCESAPYHGDYRLCVSTLIRDLSFTCNTRQLYDAYPGKARYMMQYSFPAPCGTGAHHAEDLLPTFINSNTNVTDLLIRFQNVTAERAMEEAAILRRLQAGYQPYLASYAVTGSPNTMKKAVSPDWLPATTTPDGDKLKPVLETRLEAAIHPFFGTVTDTINTKASCDFWTTVAQKISSLYGKGEVEEQLGQLLVQHPEF